MPLRRTKPLRRGKGLERGEKGLSVDPAKVRGWQDRSRAPLAPVARQGARRGTKATESLSPAQEAARSAYGANPAPCANCGWGKRMHERRDWIEAHHALSQQAIRRLCLAARVNPHDWLWDQRNRVWLCTDPAPLACHDHHTDGKLLSHRLVEAPVFEFCGELDDMLEAAGLFRGATVTLTLEWR